MTPNEVITDIQMNLCSRLFDFGFIYKSRFDSGNITLTKRTINGLVEVLLERNGNINGSNGYNWIEAYIGNILDMASPSPLEILPSKVGCYED
tara:strand:- start:885 stop:1163 length:279 start_codon:yes stop_codon:yes gene_type:complete